MNVSEQEDMEFEGPDDLDLTSPPHQMDTDTHVRIAKEQSSVFELLRKEKRGDLVLAPKFQRIDVWDRKHKSELIESILMGIPIPLIYLFENEDGVRQVIDGKQRITALKLYLNNEFPLSELSMLPKITGKKFEELSPILQSKLEDYQLHSYVIQPPTPESVKFNIFERVNRGGINLNKQEMRHALYQGRSTRLIEILAKSKEFKKATGGSIKPNRMRDRYLILRFISFYLYMTHNLDKNIQYRSDIDAFLASAMKFINTKATTELIEGTVADCIKGMSNVYQILGDEAFRFSPKDGGNRRPINMGLFETLLFAFYSIKPNEVDFNVAQKLVKERKKIIDESGLFSGALDTSDNVRERFKIAKELAEDIIDAW